jgi:protein PsiE
MIVIQSKGFDGINIIYEASGILLLAVSAYIMTMKDKISLSKIKLRKEAAAEENQEQ